jgi:hypothetical protein
MAMLVVCDVVCGEVNECEREKERVRFGGEEKRERRERERREKSTLLPRPIPSQPLAFLNPAQRPLQTLEY